jgi:alkylresorcinol/alkylpyrone synthase
MARIAAVATALPSHRVSQEEALGACERLYSGRPELRSMLRIFRSSGVEERWFSFPIDYYRQDLSFQERNLDFIDQATRLAERVARDCLSRAATPAGSIDHFLLVTTTGLATPSLDALLAPRVGLSPDCRRWPIFGLGCAGGAGALIRAADLVRADPGARVLIVAVEISGQVFSPRFLDAVDVVGSSLFGEGAAAVLVTGDRVAASGPCILATRSHLFEGSTHIMGWNFTSEGMRLKLSREIPDIIRGPLGAIAFDFLARSETPREKVSQWILHPGGRGIIDTYVDVFGLPEQAIQQLRRSLASHGNLASASVLFLLDTVLRQGAPRAGERALLMAPGPGFAAEMLVLEW